MNKRWRYTRLGLASALGILGVVAAAGVNVPQASAATPVEEQPEDKIVVIDGLSDRQSTRAASPSEDSKVPAATHEAIWAAQLAGVADVVNAYEWDEASDSLLVYASGDTGPLLRSLKRSAPKERFEVRPAVHSRAAVDEFLESIVAAGGALPDGSRVVLATPAKDGSSVTIAVETSDLSRSSVQADQQFETDIPIVVEPAPEVTPALRDITDFDAAFWSGAYMTRSSNGSWCTTGFRVQYMPTNTPYMLSADHCARPNPTPTWYNSSNVTTGNRIGTYAGMISPSSPSQIDAGVWGGSGAGKLYPYVLTGDYRDEGTLTAVKGIAALPVVGDKVCYSGSLSGRVCSNEVTFTNMLTCYQIDQCYMGQAITSQTNSIEAAGNGDSGGPVYSSVNGQLYAAGLISGMVGGSTTCTGEPGGVNNRKCSPTAIFTPMGIPLSYPGFALVVVSG